MHNQNTKMFFITTFIALISCSLAVGIGSTINQEDRTSFEQYEESTPSTFETISSAINIADKVMNQGKNIDAQFIQNNTSTIKKFKAMTSTVLADVNTIHK